MHKVLKVGVGFFSVIGILAIIGGTGGYIFKDDIWGRSSNNQKIFKEKIDFKVMNHKVEESLNDQWDIPHYDIYAKVRNNSDRGGWAKVKAFIYIGESEVALIDAIDWINPFEIKDFSMRVDIEEEEKAMFGNAKPTMKCEVIETSAPKKQEQTGPVFGRRKSWR